MTKRAAVETYQDLVEETKTHWFAEAAKGPTAICLRVTPDMAQGMLKYNRINRPIRTRHVEYFVREIQAGRFRTTHQGIAFGLDGTLLDGQHRLMAIVEAGEPVSMMVSSGLSNEAWKSIDFGSVPRTIADVTGHRKSPTETVNFLFSFSRLVVGAYKFDPDEWEPYWQVFGDGANGLYDYCSISRRGVGAAAIRAAAVYTAKTLGDETYSFSAFRAMGLQAYQDMTPAVASLNRQLLDRRMPRAEVFVRAMYAFNPAKSEHGHVLIKHLDQDVSRLRKQILATVRKETGQTGGNDDESS